jgi:hypothetical protein
METFVAGAGGFVAGALVVWLYGRSVHSVLAERISERDQQILERDAETNSTKGRVELLTAEVFEFKTKAAELSATLEQERKSAADRLAMVQRSAEVGLAQSEQTGRDLLAFVEKEAAEKLSACERAATDRQALHEKAAAEQISGIRLAADERLRAVENATQEKLALLEEARQKL